MSNFGAPTNFQVVVSNNTDENQLFQANINLNEAILENQNDYLLSVTRLKMPAGAIETIVFDDNYTSQDWWLGFRISDKDESTRIEKDYIQLLPNIDYRTSQDGIHDYLGEIRYYNNSEFLNICSRALVKAYNKFSDANATAASRIANMSNSFTFDTSTAAASTKTINITPSGSPFNANFKIQNFYFIVKEFVATQDVYTYSTDYNVTNSRTFNPTTDLYKGNIKITATHPNATSIVLYQGIASDLYVGRTQASFHFNEGHYLPFGHDKTKFLNSGTNRCYLPNNESLSKFNGLTATGQWTITLTAENTIYGYLNWDLVAKMVDSTKYPTTTPTFSINDTSKSIMLSYSQNHPLLGCKLIMSPKVKKLLNFGVQYHNFSLATESNLSKASYVFQYPPFIAQTTDTIIEITQERSTLAYLNNMSRLIINSKNIDASGDLEVSDGLTTNNQLASTQTIIDFVLDNNENGLSDLDYSTDASLRGWRVYEMNSGLPLKSISLQAYMVYFDGTVREVLLEPNSQAIVRLTFYPK